MAEVTKEDLIANDEFIWTYEVNGKTFRFRMPNENTNTINVEAAKPYVQSMKDLINSARSVRQQKLFGNIDIQGLAKSYSFEPFGYQIENVKTMLNRFEGNGVFGDQVGLGKTVQALMTAHAMFASGAIRNALIIVPTNTKAGWEKEIKQKFAGVFNLIDLDSRTDFFGVLERIRDNNKTNEQEKRVYIVTAQKFESQIKRIAAAERKIRYRNAMSKELTTEEEKVFEKIEEDLKTDSSINAILGKYGWTNDIDYPRSEDRIHKDMFFLYGMTRKKYERLQAILDKISKGKIKVKNLYGNKQEEATRLIEEIKSELARQEELSKLSDDKVCEMLFETSTRLIDLLIVDEIHSFFETENSKGETVRDEEGIQSAVDVLARINKKFCVLLSATPVRTRLENIFDLIYISNRAKVGTDKAAALDYFYTTICQLPEDMDKEFALSTMMLDDNLSRNFFGMVNGFFTRKRIQDVTDQMYRGKEEKQYEKTYDNLNGQDFFDDFVDKVKNKRTIMYLQTATQNAKTAAEEAYDRWRENALEKGVDLRHFYDALDAALMEMIKTEQEEPKENSVERIKRLHPFVNWNRRGKQGVALMPLSAGSSVVEEKSQDQELINSVVTLVGSDSVFAKTGRMLYHTQSVNSVNFEEQGIVGLPNNEANLDEIKKIINGIVESLQHDSVAVYVSRKKIATTDNVRKDIKVEIDKTSPCLRCSSKKKKKSEELEEEVKQITEDNYNHIAILDQGDQAGVNLQQYRTFVFASLDWKGQRLLEPVDIEQFIGRIHRTGQVKNCRIITILKTYFSSGEQYDPEFLKWYYEILSDPEGLDLYGDNTPDIAFLQPVIVNNLRHCFCSSSWLDDGEKAEVMQESFAKLLLRCYNTKDESLKESIKKNIRVLCQTDGFGKLKKTHLLRRLCVTLSKIAANKER